jgi:hypothetical protein
MVLWVKTIVLLASVFEAAVGAGRRARLAPMMVTIRGKWMGSSGSFSSLLVFCWIGYAGTQVTWAGVGHLLLG